MPRRANQSGGRVGIDITCEGGARRGNQDHSGAKIRAGACAPGRWGCGPGIMPGARLRRSGSAGASTRKRRHTVASKDRPGKEKKKPKKAKDQK